MPHREHVFPWYELQLEVSLEVAHSRLKCNFRVGDTGIKNNFYATLASILLKVYMIWLGSINDRATGTDMLLDGSIPLSISIGSCRVT